MYEEGTGKRRGTRVATEGIQQNWRGGFSRLGFRELAAALVTGRRVRVLLPGVVSLALFMFPWLGGNFFWLREICLIAISFLMVSGLNLTYGYLGDFQFAQVAGFALGAYITGIASTRGFDEIIPLLLLSGLAASCIGLVLSLLAVRAEGWSLAMMSFFLVLLIPDLVEIAQRWTGGAIGVVGIPSPRLFGSNLGTIGLYEVTCVTAVVWLAFLRNLVTSRYGQMLRVVREGRSLASSLGISSFQVKLGAYAWGMFPTGVAGCLLAYLNETVSSSTFGITVTISVLAASILGGAESVYGAVAGAAILELGPLRSTSFQQYALVVYGAFLIAVAILLRSGLKGIVSSQLVRLARAGVLTEAPTKTGEKPGERALVKIAMARHSGESIRLDGVTKTFGGNVAVNAMSLVCEGGQVTGLIGANGSGKTTLLNMISGLVKLDAGAVWLGNDQVAGHSPRDIAKGSHLARTFQTPSIPRGITVLDVVATGRYQLEHCGLLASVTRMPRYWRTSAVDGDRARAALDVVGMSRLESVEATTLSLGSRRLLEIARSLCAHPRFLLLDEPASGLASEEVDRLGSILRAVADGGTTVVLVEHNFRFLSAVADNVHVLEVGSLIFSGTPAAAKADQRVAESFLGQAAALMSDDPELLDLAPQSSVVHQVASDPEGTVS